MRRLLVAAIGLTGCVLDGPSPDLELDMGRSCDAIALEVRDAHVLPGWDVHALAVEHSDGARVWALASNGKGALRLKAWPDGPEHDLTALGHPEQFHLLAGPIEGETWLVLDQDIQAQVWRIKDGDDEALPTPAVAALTTGASWRLLFLGAVPYLLAAPRSGDASTIFLSIFPIDPETLTVGQAGAVPLWVACSTPACGARQLTGPVLVDPLEAAQSGPLGDAAMLVGVYSAKTPDTPPTDNLHRAQLLQLQLRSLGADRLPGVTQSVILYPPSIGPMVFSPAFLVADADGYYGLVGQTPLESGPVPVTDLVFHMTRRNAYATIATAQRSLRSHLLQVGSRAAFGQISGDNWTIAPLSPEGVDTELIAQLAIENDSAISSAGRGEFLVRDDGRSRRVAAACATDGE